MTIENTEFRKEFEQRETEAMKKPLTGISGWLALWAIGMLFGPVRQLVETAEYAEASAYTETDWAMFAQYNGGTALAQFETYFPWVNVIYIFILSGLFFYKSRYFPKAYVVAVAIAPIYYAFLILGWATVVGLPIGKMASLTMEDPEIVKSIMQSVMCLPWVAYLFMSRRVKNTFTR